MKIFKNVIDEVISLEALFMAWDEFRRGKTGKDDVLKFGYELESQIFALHLDLQAKTYRHGPYKAFSICDPKPRRIHKALVRDRIVHHAVFKVLYRVFEPTFIADSFSCRIGKGTHKGVRRLQAMIRQVSKNGTKSCFALKCDVRKFFDSVDHGILLTILKKRIADPNLLWLFEGIIASYSSSDMRERERERE
ncbi:MAG: Retron-type reverse transcriptase [Candidatus Andersenbacteria bacterium]|nr:Retron-type reverse transcriptase [Candidatus Andersenbacteria bacterium]